jgi:glycyl-tRNA synthetase
LSCILQAASSEGEGGLLSRVMVAFARPTRIVRGKEVSASWAVDEARFELEEERALWGAYREAAAKVDASMGIRDFLQVGLGLSVHDAVVLL